MNVDFQAWQKIAELKVSSWWQSLTPDDFYNAWVASGVVWFLFLFWVCHRIMRKALGHVLYRGTWYNAEQFETLVKMIDEDCERGNRVMKHDEMQVLRRWRFGSSKGISDGVKGGYF
jgi:hypothetical protein